MYKLHEGDRVRVLHPTSDKEKDLCFHSGFEDWFKVPNGATGTIIKSWDNVCSIAFDKAFPGSYGSTGSNGTFYLNTWNMCSILLHPIEKISIEELIIRKIKYLDKRYQDKQHAKSNV